MTKANEKTVNAILAVMIEETLEEGGLARLVPVGRRLAEEWRSRGAAAFEGVELYDLADISAALEVVMDATDGQFPEGTLAAQDLNDAINEHLARVDG
jgi:hypothetical protein